MYFRFQGDPIKGIALYGERRSPNTLGISHLWEMENCVWCFDDLHDWAKRSGSCRRRFIQRFPAFPQRLQGFPQPKKDCGNRNPLRNVGAGIDINAIIGDTKVEMVTGSNTGSTHGADGLTGADILAGGDTVAV